MTSDVILILILGSLELLLSADNAIVLTALIRNLPEKQQRPALFTGLFSILLLRGLALFFASYLLHLLWLQTIGGIYLFYIAYRHLFAPPSLSPSPPPSFFKTVVLIELYDLLFAIDSILAGLAFIDNDPNKLSVVYVGGLIGIIGVRFAATGFQKLIHKRPQLETGAYLLIAWTGVKLFLAPFYHISELPFWTVSILVVLFPLFWRRS
jgi:YkoY family integral membrane protein